MRTLCQVRLVAVFAFLFSGAGSAFADELESYIRFPRVQPAASSTYSVASICQAYNFPKSQASGAVIGILELGGGFIQSDLNRFSKLNGLPTITVTSISVNGGQNRPGGSADSEVALDIEVIAAAYYYSTGKMPTIKVFFAPNNFNSFAPVVSAAVAANCDVLSISWGAPESSWSSTTLTSLDGLISSAAASGLTVFAASGDNSSSDGATGKNVDAPASCPHVIGCGGTTKMSTSETAWGTGSSTAQGTGGGYSKVFPVQSFQVGAPSGSGRMVPDVAAEADPNTGYQIVVHGRQKVVGGTSAVAPLYAALFAASGKKLGFVTPKLWKNAAVFVDIKTGSNGDFTATVGPDACTGLGVPNGASISNLLKTSSHVFQVAALGLNDTSGTFSLPLDVSASGTGVLQPLSGSSPTMPGSFAAVVVDLPNLFGGSSAPRIYGVGMGRSKLNPYLFNGE